MRKSTTWPSIGRKPMPTSKSRSPNQPQYFVFKREGGWSSAGKWVLKDYVQDQMYLRRQNNLPALIADVKANSVYQALPDDKKSYDLPKYAFAKRKNGFNRPFFSFFANAYETLPETETSS
jgi:hypothetical protein